MTRYRTFLTNKPFDFDAPYEKGSEKPVYWFIFRGHRVLVEKLEGGLAIPCVVDPAGFSLTLLSQHYIGSYDGTPCFAGEVEREVDAPAGMTFQNIRRLYQQTDEDFLWVAGRAVQVVDWYRNHAFCGKCGQATTINWKDRSRVCEPCKKHYYPRLSPAIIVAVVKEGKLLLARSGRHPAGFYSVLAGFVEPGETLEGTVKREVLEEVGLHVKNIRYFGSQPWPFPNSLMLGFTCEYESGEFVLQDDEISEANWYAPDKLPNVPPPLSISRHLINWFTDTYG